MSSHLNTVKRQQVVRQVLNATTLPEIDAATQALDTWLALHPEDLGLEDGYEQLALMRQAILSTDRELARP